MPDTFKFIGSPPSVGEVVTERKLLTSIGDTTPELGGDKQTLQEDSIVRTTAPLESYTQENQQQKELLQSLSVITLH